MLSIEPPKTNYTLLEEIGKFNILWNASIVLVPIFIALTILQLSFSDPSWATSTAATFLALVNLIVLKKTRKYIVIAYASVFFGVIICQSTIFLINDSHIITDVMWCIFVAFFTFFVLGIRSGIFILMLNLTGILAFLLIGDLSQVSNDGMSFNEVDFKMVLNVYLVAIALAFIIYNMVNTNRKINKRFEEQLDHKQVLLKEIHHRVKNNLQIVSSLLKLQAAEVESKLVEEQFGEAISRIRSMALIHEKMYQEDDLAKLDIKSYLLSLADDISTTIQSDTNLEVNVESEINKIDLKYVVSLSLIFNELMTNSIKHGFSDKSDGQIDVKIISKNDKVIFYYSDNGTWKAPVSNSSFGLELLETLTEQLDGTIERTVTDTTNYILTFDTDSLFIGDENPVQQG